MKNCFHLSLQNSISMWKWQMILKFILLTSQYLIPWLTIKFINYVCNLKNISYLSDTYHTTSTIWVMFPWKLFCVSFSEAKFTHNSLAFFFSLRVMDSKYSNNLGNMWNNEKQLESLVWTNNGYLTLSSSYSLNLLS